MGSASDNLMRRLRLFHEKVWKSCGVRQMILFGSHAHGKTHRFSDVDVIVVSERFRGKGAIERAVPLYLAWAIDLPVDFLCYTPDEFRALARRPGIVREALREGVWISGPRIVRFE